MRLPRRVKSVWSRSNWFGKFVIVSAVGYWMIWGLGWIVEWPPFLTMALLIYAGFMVIAGLVNWVLLGIQLRKLHRQRIETTEEILRLLDSFDREKS